MEKILFISKIISEYYLIEYPLNEDFFNYIKGKFKRKNKEKLNKELVTEKEQFIQTFIIKDDNNNKIVLDLSIDEKRYISFPIWIDNNKYYEDLKLINQNKNTKNNESLLIMFNIVCVLDKKSTLTLNKDLVKKILINLEAISNIFLFEEYRKKFILKELTKFINTNKRFFNDENNENINYNNFKEVFIFELYKNIENIFHGIKKNCITKIFINNLEFRYNFQISISNSNYYNIKPFHSVIIQKTKEVIDFFRKNIDINPTLLLILENISPFKSIEDISLEYNIDFQIIVFFVNQLVSWNFAKLIYKIGNHSLFEINPKMNLNKEINRNQFFPFNFFSVLKIFSTIEPGTSINSLYSKYFENQMDKGKFLTGLIYLLENEFIVLSSMIIICILPFKFKYDYEKCILDSLGNLIKKQNNVNMTLEDLNINGKENDNNNNIENNKKINIYHYNKSKNITYYEDILLEIKEISIEDYYVLNSITGLIQKKIYIEEISYYSNYKINKILETVKKYPQLFNIIIVPI